jgi:hypothetical protein
MALMTRAPGESDESWERRCSILLLAIKRVSALPHPHCWLIPPPLPILPVSRKFASTFTWEPVT